MIGISMIEKYPDELIEMFKEKYPDAYNMVVLASNNNDYWFDAIDARHKLVAFAEGYFAAKRSIQSATKPK